MTGPGGRGHREWFSAEELAALRLPGLPSSKRHLNDRAREERWAFQTDASGAPLARRRAGRGGGIEYHISVLPPAARAALTRVADVRPMEGRPANDEAPSAPWAWFDRQTDKVKDEARRRLAIVTMVSDLEQAGFSRSSAISEVAGMEECAASTLWGWFRLLVGLPQADWLPALAPRRRGGGAEADIDDEIWTLFKTDYLRPEKPTLAACYRRAKRIAEAMGLAIPIMKTFQRKLEREVDPRVILLKRDGGEALRRAMPAQRRTVAGLHALQLVNIDGHKFDLFCSFGKDAKGEDIVRRPIMVAIQDIMSRKVLAWRIGEAESAVLTRLAFADLFRRWGIPKGCLLDNGRAFASKWITGGALTRYRFRIREEDPTGLLPALGINPHWATPYRGQSKPIERAFRDYCANEIARGPRCHGAYVGNRPDAKPENYGARVIPIEEFRLIVAEEVAVHNARRGRRTEMANGRSFDEAFAESYAAAPIGKATEEQLRIALLAGENRRVDRRTGEIGMLGNRYWSEDLRDHYGATVTVRFDPDDLHQPLHVYDLAGRYLCSAPIMEDTGFQDVESARSRAKAEAAWRKAARDAAALEQLLTAADVAARLPAMPEVEMPEPVVIRPVRARTGSAALKSAPNTHQDQFMDQFDAALTRLRLVEK